MFGIYSLSSSLNTGNGNDIITVTGRDSGILIYSSSLDTGNGNDIIIATGTFDLENYWNSFNTGTGTLGIGNYSSTFNTGDGNDIITGNGAGIGAGISNSQSASIDTGDGNDIISGINTKGNPTIRGGLGILNDGIIDTMMVTTESLALAPSAFLTLV